MLTIQANTYTEFNDDNEYRDRLVSWGLSTGKAKETKKDFLYKGQGQEMTCRIVGYIDDLTLVLQLDNGKTHCIHPSYLKEMQSKAFTSKISSADTDVEVEQPEHPEQPTDAETAEDSTSKAEAKGKAKPKKEKAPAKVKLDLPEEKVSFKASISEFATVYNHFKQENDDIIIYKDVAIVNDENTVLEVGTAWSSYSATLKKLGLEEGDQLQFEAKITDKKLNKEVLYKINNPSKIEKPESAKETFE